MPKLPPKPVKKPVKAAKSQPKFKTLVELFSDKSRWTTGARSRTKGRTLVAPDDPEAVCWCLYGGLELVYGESAMGGESKDVPMAVKMRKAANELGYEGEPLAKINDSLGYDVVMAIIKKAKV